MTDQERLNACLRRVRCSSFAVRTTSAERLLPLPPPRCEFDGAACADVVAATDCKRSTVAGRRGSSPSTVARHHRRDTARPSRCSSSACSSRRVVDDKSVSARRADSTASGEGQEGQEGQDLAAILTCPKGCQNVKFFFLALLYKVIPVGFFSSTSHANPCFFQPLCETCGRRPSTSGAFDL